MAQVRSPKFLFFCFFSGATTENVYQAMHNFVMQLVLRGKKMCPLWLLVNLKLLTLFEVCLKLIHHVNCNSIKGRVLHV